MQWKCLSVHRLLIWGLLGKIDWATRMWPWVLIVLSNVVEQFQFAKWMRSQWRLHCLPELDCRHLGVLLLKWLVHVVVERSQVTSLGWERIFPKFSWLEEAVWIDLFRQFFMLSNVVVYIVRPGQISMVWWLALLTSRSGDRVSGALRTHFGC